MSNLLDSVLAELRSPARTKPIKQIADEAGVSYFTIQKWMRQQGTQNPRVDSVQKLADYFERQRQESPPRRRAS